MFETNAYYPWAYAHGKPMTQGDLRVERPDFEVEECLSFALCGQGEHVFVFVEKEGLNTEQVAKMLAKAVGIPHKLVSYAGLKDKNARTRQWFSLHLPGKQTLSLEELNHDAPYRCLKAIRHNKKLRLGALAYNQFHIHVKNLVQPSAVDFNARLELIKQKGVPNYFGEQRFGRQGQNIEKAKALLEGKLKVKNKYLKGLYYSSARAYLFNILLSQRVNALDWPYALDGDVMMLEGCHSYFKTDAIDSQTRARIQQKDIAPAGPLWGRGKPKNGDKAQAFEEQSLNDLDVYRKGLEDHGLTLMYRPFLLHPQDIIGKLADDGAHLAFKLPSGAYATSVLRELFDYRDVRRQNEA